MRVAVWQSRALAVALVFAAAAFCYAVATGDPEVSGASVRAVGTGTPLRFTTPVVASVPTEFDLGDAAFGSTITRYITAEGGVRPYRFTSEGDLRLERVIAGFQTTLQLGFSGILAGSLPPRPLDSARQPLNFPSRTVTGAEGFRFQVTVRDAKGTSPSNASGMFNLFLVDSGGFRFAMDKLPDARLAAQYLARIEVLGGRGGVTFSALSVTNGTTGAAMTQEDLGLFVTTDGAVIGRPLQAGTFNVTVQCLDGRGQRAVARNQSGPNQMFTIVVRDEPVTSSELTTMQCFINGDARGGGKDSLSYKGILNMAGQDDFQLLNSEFVFQIGGVAIAGRLDEKGQFRDTLRDLSLVQVKVSATRGTVDVKIKNGNFAAGLGAAQLQNGLTRKPVQAGVGQGTASSEVLDFETRVDGASYQLRYRLGTSGVNAAGAFQITSVRGKDKTTLTGQLGDAWRIGFLAVPRNSVQDPTGRRQGFDGVTGATVRIGTNFVQQITGAPLRVTNGKISFGGGSATGVKRFVLAPGRSVGRIDTGVLSVKTTDIPLASDASRFGAVFLPLGVDLVRGTDAPFSGEHARRIFGLNNQYKDVPPKR